MIRMPDSVEFFGRCSYGHYKGEYFTRTGEVKATVEGLGETIITGRVKGNTVEAELDGVSSKDVEAIHKKFGGGFFTFSAEDAGTSDAESDESDEAENGLDESEAEPDEVEDEPADSE